MRRPRITPQEDSWYPCLLETESTSGPVRLEGFGSKLKKKIHLTATRTRDLPACGIVPQPTTLPLAPTFALDKSIKIIFDVLTTLTKRHMPPIL
jgi:hypothetical protein